MSALLLLYVQGIVVGSEVKKLQNAIQKSYPHIELLLLPSPQDLMSNSQPKLNYTKLTSHQAKCVLYETLSRIGLDPEYILPRRDGIEWQIDELRDCLLVRINMIILVSGQMHSL